jgi:hypothetical protein
MRKHEVIQTLTISSRPYNIKENDRIYNLESIKISHDN